MLKHFFYPWILSPLVVFFIMVAAAGLAVTKYLLSGLSLRRFKCMST